MNQSKTLFGISYNNLMYRLGLELIYRIFIHYTSKFFYFTSNSKYADNNMLTKSMETYRRVVIDHIISS